MPDWVIWVIIAVVAIEIVHGSTTARAVTAALTFSR